MRSCVFAYLSLLVPIALFGTACVSSQDSRRTGGADTEPQASGTTAVLPPEARREKARLEHLFEGVVRTYPCDVRDQVNEMIPRVQSVTFAQDIGELSGVTRIPIPPDVVRVWCLFNDLRIHGSGLGLPGQAVHFDTPLGRRAFGFWRQGDTMLAGHSNRMPVDDTDYEGYAIEVEGGGRIDRVVLRSTHGVSAEFDDNPWSTLGKDKPIEAVTVVVDATHRRAIAGSVRLERERFWRVASHNGTHPEGIVAATYCAQRGFLPGRGIWKLDGLTRWGYGGATLREDPERPGVPDYAPFAALEFDAEAARIREDAFPRDFKYATCFDNWPPFMALKGTRVKNHRGTPADFPEAAKLASAAIGWQRTVRGTADHWWEVKNESTITDEWVLHAEDDVDSWGLLAEFHNTMADTIHQDHPDALVGGPTSAWMALHHGGFSLARKQMRFMDETKHHLDFYSHHFYEGKQLILSEGDAYSGGYLMGRLEGCLDLLRNHMVLTDNVKPMIISETGTLYGRNTEMGIWLNTKNLSSYLMRYMDHPDKIDLVSLWLVPVNWWDRNSRTLFNRAEDGTLEIDERVGYVLELWKDFRGERLPASIATMGTNVHLQAVVDGRTVWVAINNLNPHRIAVDVSLLSSEATPVRIEQTRLYFDRGKIHFQTLERASLQKLPVAVEETSLVKITFDRPPPARGILNETTYYGDRVLQPTGAPAAFSLPGPAGPVHTARLRVCLSRNGGFAERLSVRLNGKPVAQGRVVTPVRKSGNYWGFLTIPVPGRLIGRENTVHVHVPEEGGTITSVALVASRLRPSADARPFH